MFFSIMVVIKCARSSGVDQLLTVISTTAFAPVPIFPMLTANAVMSSLSSLVWVPAIGGNANINAAATMVPIACLITISPLCRRVSQTGKINVTNPKVRRLPGLPDRRLANPVCQSQHQNTSWSSSAC